jgi:hypothetical protein
MKFIHKSLVKCHIYQRSRETKNTSAELGYIYRRAKKQANPLVFRHGDADASCVRPDPRDVN